MTTTRLAKILIEGPELAKDAGADQADADNTDVDKKISVYVNRLLLRIFSISSLRAALANVSLFRDPESKDGQCKVQLDFIRLPEEVHPQVVRLCAAPRPPRLMAYEKNGSARTGIEILVRPDDFGGEDLDYDT